MTREQIKSTPDEKLIKRADYLAGKIEAGIAGLCEKLEKIVIEAEIWNRNSQEERWKQSRY